MEATDSWYSNFGAADTPEMPVPDTTTATAPLPIEPTPAVHLIEDTVASTIEQGVAPSKTVLSESVEDGGNCGRDGGDSAAARRRSAAAQAQLDIESRQKLPAPSATGSRAKRTLERSAGNFDGLARGATERKHVAAEAGIEARAANRDCVDNVAVQTRRCDT